VVLGMEPVSLSIVFVLVVDVVVVVSRAGREEGRDRDRTGQNPALVGATPLSALHATHARMRRHFVAARARWHTQAASSTLADMMRPRTTTRLSC
jgi:hypothetical protein